MPFLTRPISDLQYKSKTPSQRVARLTVTLIFCIFFFVFSGLTACKKSDMGHSPLDGKFSFTYNGIKYVLPYKEGVAEWSVWPGLYIYRPDLFDGTIRMPSAYCGYLEPQYDDNISVGANCQLSSKYSGYTIDSVEVYFYQSGFFNISYKNCREQKEYQPYSGRTLVYDVCDAYGTFDLTLRNKENKTIVITDGTFEAYNLAKR